MTARKSIKKARWFHIKTIVLIWLEWEENYLFSMATATSSATFIMVVKAV